MANKRKNGVKEDTFRKNDKANARNRNAKGKDRKFDKKEDRYDAEANRGKTRASNDPAWYGANSGLMKDAANLSFHQMGGMPFTIVTSGGNANSQKQRLPGIYKADYLPMPGMLGDWTAPFNVAIRRIYSFIRHANSGHSNYDAADLGNYVLAYDSVVTMYAWMVRVYGMVRTVVLRNRFTPEVITRVLGVDYNSIVSNLAQFRYYINTFAARANAMKVPATFNLYQRHMWLASHVFMDAPVEQAQYYLPNPKWLWRFEVDEDSAQHVIFPLYNYSSSNNTYVEDINAPLTYENIKEKAEILLNTILNSEDFNIMSGDVMKAYGDKVFTLNGISEDYLTIPVFDPEFTLQFNNATIFTFPTTDTNSGFPRVNTGITEDTSETANVGALVFKPNLNNSDSSLRFFEHSVADTAGKRAMSNNMYGMISKICNMPMSNPTSADVAVATRMMVQVESTSGPNWRHVNNPEGRFTSYGTEIFLNAELYSLGDDALPVKVGYAQDPEDSVNTEIFTAHPYYFDIKVSVDGGDPQNYYDVRSSGSISTLFDSFVPYGDFDNFAVITPEVLYNIHSAALYGIYGLVE